MSLENLSPTAIKIGLTIPCVLLAVGIYMVIHGIPLPPAQPGFWLIGTTAIAWGGIAVIRKMSRSRKALWLVFFGFMTAHCLLWTVLWGHFANFGGIYFAGTAIAELYLLGWLLTWLAVRPQVGRRRNRRSGKAHNSST